MKDNKKQYQQIELKLCLLEQSDVVRTSNGAEMDYKEQNWGSSDKGFDTPFVD